MNPTGLVRYESEDGQRAAIRTIHGATARLVEELKAEWSDCPHQLAHRKLSLPDVQVTNQSDKAIQLQKLQNLNELVSRVMRRSEAQSSSTTLSPVQARLQKHLPSPPPSTRRIKLPSTRRASEDKEVTELKAMFGKPDVIKETQSEVSGLSALLTGLNLEDKLARAQEWCQEQGIDSIAELREVNMASDMAAALGLKPAKMKLLLKRIDEHTME